MTEAVLICENHPDRETSLRCNRCGKPICTSCAVQTPVGYRCRECVRGQQEAFETASNLQLGLAAVIAGVGAVIAFTILGRLGIFFGLILSLVAGGGMAELIRLAMRGYRSRNLPLAAAVGAGAGVVLLVLSNAIGRALLHGSESIGLGFVLTVGLDFLLPLLYSAVMIGTLFYRLRTVHI